MDSYNIYKHIHTYNTCMCVCCIQWMHSWNVHKIVRLFVPFVYLLIRNSCSMSRKLYKYVREYACVSVYVMSVWHVCIHVCVRVCVKVEEEKNLSFSLSLCPYVNASLCASVFVHAKYLICVHCPLSISYRIEIKTEKQVIVFAVRDLPLCSFTGTVSLFIYLFNLFFFNINF